MWTFHLCTTTSQTELSLYLNGWHLQSTIPLHPIVTCIWIYVAITLIENCNWGDHSRVKTTLQSSLAMPSRWKCDLCYFIIFNSCIYCIRVNVSICMHACMHADAWNMHLSLCQVTRYEESGGEETLDSTAPTLDWAVLGSQERGVRSSWDTLASQLGEKQGHLHWLLGVKKWLL